MRKFLIVLLGALLAATLSVAALAEGDNALRFVEGEELVLFDENGLKLALTGEHHCTPDLPEEPPTMETMNAVLTNHTGRDIRVEGKIGEMGVFSDPYKTFKDGTSEDTHLFLYYVWNEGEYTVGMDAFRTWTDLEANFTVMDGETGETIFTVGPIALHLNDPMPEGERSAAAVATPEPGEPVDSYFVDGERRTLFDRNGLKVVFTGKRRTDSAQPDRAPGLEYIEAELINGTGKDIRIKTESEDPSGGMASGILTGGQTTIKAGSTEKGEYFFLYYDPIKMQQEFTAGMNAFETWTAMRFEFTVVDGDTGLPMFIVPVTLHFNETPPEGAEEPEPEADPAKEYTDKATLKAVQEALNAKGYNCGTPDGIIGKNSQSAIRAFQKDNDLAVTGTVTGELLEALGIQAP